MSNTNITQDSLAQIRALVQQSKASAKPKREVDPTIAAARAAARADRDAKREALKLERASTREAKRAERAAAKGQSNSGPAYTRRLEKLAAGLPAMTDNVVELFDLAKELSNGDLAVFSAHVNYEQRRRGLTAATQVVGKTEFKTGDAVLIRECSHNPKFNGMTGIVSEARRIRAFVKVPGHDTAAYCFISELEPVQIEGLEETPAAIEQTA